jgi:hypothetical protein
MRKLFVATPARATWVASTFIGRIVFRRQIAAARRRAMTVVAGATVGGIVALSLFAAYEQLRDD